MLGCHEQPQVNRDYVQGSENAAVMMALQDCISMLT